MALVTKNVGYFERLWNSFKWIIGWFIMVGLGIWLLFWNEWRTIHTREALSEGEASVVSVTAYDSVNDGKLVHYTNMASADGNLEVAELGISEENALKWSVNWEVLQWKEESKTTTEDNLGGSQTQTTEYSYKTDWSSSKVDSSDFAWPDAKDHQNTLFVTLDAMGIRQYVEMPNIKVGEYWLSNWLASEISSYENYAITSGIVSKISELAAKSLSGTFNNISQQGQYLYLRQGTWESVGDARMTLRIIKDQDVSILGSQQAQLLWEYKASNGIEISQLNQGKYTAAEMFAEAHSSNELMKWVLRILSFFIILAWFKAIFAPLAALANVVPFIASIIWFGTWLVAGVLTILVYVITMAIAWMRYSPVFAISVLAIWALVAWLIVWRKKSSGLDPIPEMKKEEDKSEEIVEA